MTDSVPLTPAATPREYRHQLPAGHLDSSGWLALAAGAAASGEGFLRILPGGVIAIRGGVATPPGLPAPASVCVVADPLSARARAVARELSTVLTTAGLHTVHIGVSESSPQPDVVLETLRPHIHIELSESGETIHTPSHQPGSILDSTRVKPLEEHIGWLPHPDVPGIVSLGTVVPDGVMPHAHAELIGRMEVDTTITGWGGIIFHDLPEADADVVLRFLAPRGFIFDAARI